MEVKLPWVCPKYVSPPKRGNPFSYYTSIPIQHSVFKQYKMVLLIISITIFNEGNYWFLGTTDFPDPIEYTSQCITHHFSVMS